jgi:hypothetical protein
MAPGALIALMRDVERVADLRRAGNLGSGATLPSTINQGVHLVVMRVVGAFPGVNRDLALWNFSPSCKLRRGSATVRGQPRQHANPW